MSRPVAPDLGAQLLAALTRCLDTRIGRLDDLRDGTPSTLRQVRGISMQVLYDAVLRPRDDDERALGALCQKVSVDLLMLVADRAVLNWWLPPDLRLSLDRVPVPAAPILPEVFR